VLRQKYESPMFMKQWEDAKSKINTRCRGKRRTVQRRLHKQVNFETVYLSAIVFSLKYSVKSTAEVFNVRK